MKDNKKYIYNMKQANFIMHYGIKCLGVGKHHHTKKMYFVFNHFDVQPALEAWRANKPV